MPSIPSLSFRPVGCLTSLPYRQTATSAVRTTPCCIAASNGPRHFRRPDCDCGMGTFRSRPGTALKQGIRIMARSGHTYQGTMKPELWCRDEKSPIDQLGRHWVQKEPWISTSGANVWLGARAVWHRRRCRSPGQGKAHCCASAGKRHDWGQHCLPSIAVTAQSLSERQGAAPQRTQTH